VHRKKHNKNETYISNIKHIKELILTKIQLKLDLRFVEIVLSQSNSGTMKLDKSFLSCPEFDEIRGHMKRIAFQCKILFLLM